MCDEQNTLALFAETAHDLHQLVDLLGRQNSGRLVKDQDLIVTIEHLEDLDTLLHTDGNIGYNGVRIDLEAVALGQVHDLFAGGSVLQKTILCIFHAQNDIVQDREAFDQFEVLVDHADSQPVGVIGVLDPYFFTVLFDGTLFRLV